MQTILAYYSYLDDKFTIINYIDFGVLIIDLLYKIYIIMFRMKKFSISNNIIILWSYPVSPHNSQIIFVLRHGYAFCDL